MRWKYVIIIWLTLPITALSGLFDPDKPTVELDGGKLVNLSHDAFILRLSDFRSMGAVEPLTKARREALAARDEMTKKRDPSPADMVRLGNLRLRLREHEAAIADLRSAYDRNRSDFWAMSSLGTANLQSGQATDAANFLEAARGQYLEAKKSKVPISPPLSDEAWLIFDKEVALARLRRLEELRAPPGRRAAPVDDVDDLFGIKFVGESGAYEAGTLSASEKAKLPKEAIAIVQRLLYWLPDDARLYWHLGELYNANGDIDAALSVFNECLDSRRFDTPKLREHRQVLMAAVAARPAPPIAWLPDQGRVIAVAVMALLVLFGLFCLQYRQVRRKRTR